jgi:hypothetical protein
MKVSKKLRDQILDTIAAASLEEIAVHCPGAAAGTRRSLLEQDEFDRLLVIEAVTTAITRKLSAKLNILIT